MSQETTLRDVQAASTDTRLATLDGVNISWMSVAASLPLLFTPDRHGVDISTWGSRNEVVLQEHLRNYGALLFRGFAISTVPQFEKFVSATSGAPLPYTERSSPRQHVDRHIYTSTEHPKDMAIFLHNEQSYNLQFPSRIYFCCLEPAESGGETPIADCRKVYARLSKPIINQFADGYMYVRNFGRRLGLSWQEAFQTTQREAVDEYCRRNLIECEWQDYHRLRTRQVRRAFAPHPETRQMTWFNHLTFFNLATLPQDIQELLRAECGSDLPNQTYYADGTDIDTGVLAHLIDAYESEMVLFRWEAGDVLLLDNMLIAHGRRSFTGRRRVIVAMARPWSWSDLQSPASPFFE